MGERGYEKEIHDRIGAPAGASVSADVAAVKTDTAAVLVDTADMQPKIGTPAADISADIAAVKVDTAAVLADTGTDGVVAGSRTTAYTRLAGMLQMAATTIDLNQAAATYVLFTATTQDVVVEALTIRMSGGAIGGAVTSISIQTDDATAQVFIDSVTGAVANLTNEAQLAWTGAVLLDAGTGATIGLTIGGGAAGVAKVCDVVAQCRAVVSGGYLA